jgi:hypothetical protein
MIFQVNLLQLLSGSKLRVKFFGWRMDIFKQSFNDLESIRYAMTVTSFVFIPSVISFLLVSTFLPRDWKAAEERKLNLAKGES